RELDNAVPLDMVRQMPSMEAVTPSRYFTEARFGKWDAILKEPAPPADMTFTTGVWHYARGLAFAAKNRPDDALNEKNKLDAIVASTPPDRVVGFNSANRLLAMASATLAGAIDSAKGNHDDAIKSLKDAVAIQDALNYEEPPPWYYPVRETLYPRISKLVHTSPVDAARLARTPVNVIDRPEFCDFSFGAIVNRSPLVIGISTDGAAPVIAFLTPASGSARLKDTSHENRKSLQNIHPARIEIQPGSGKHGPSENRGTHRALRSRPDPIL
ncbi:MAG: hypothetical protein ABSF22_07795, partial [Bryobacteraceae bacterium]